jgi:DNA (cytosine-5)-methyltransferase 1
MAAFTFIDLFAGIGGTRLGFQSAGGKCVFTSEWDKHAQKTYEANFGDAPVGDIREIKTSQIPDFDILLAGFPCQPFSIAGVSKKISLGRAHGFSDEKQGNLFFEIARIIQDKQPSGFMLENVKNLVSHDKGNTFKTILAILDELGYTVSYKVIDAKYFVPQHRERTYIVGFRKDLVPEDFAFTFPEIPEKGPVLASILEDNVDDKYTLSDKLWQYLQNYAAKHKEKGNGFGFGLADRQSNTRTLSARYYKDGSEILIAQSDKKNPRRLTPRECARLMGFPDTYKIVVSDTQAYRQFGNSIVVPAVSAVAKQVAATLEQYGKAESREKKLEHVPNSWEKYIPGNAGQKVSEPAGLSVSSPLLETPGQA